MQEARRAGGAALPVPVAHCQVEHGQAVAARGALLKVAVRARPVLRQAPQALAVRRAKVGAGLCAAQRGRLLPAGHCARVAAGRAAPVRVHQAQAVQVPGARGGAGASGGSALLVQRKAGPRSGRAEAPVAAPPVCALAVCAAVGGALAGAAQRERSVGGGARAAGASAVPAVLGRVQNAQRAAKGVVLAAAAAAVTVLHIAGCGMEGGSE